MRVVVFYLLHTYLLNGWIDVICKKEQEGNCGYSKLNSKKKRAVFYVYQLRSRSNIEDSLVARQPYEATALVGNTNIPTN